ncbi:MAG: hypothetical protein AAF599_05350 [Bacteroidota bacterium]
MQIQIQESSFHSYHFISTVPPYILSDALSSCLGGMLKSKYAECWDESYRDKMLHSIKQIQLQIEEQIESHFIYIVQAKRGKAIKGCFVNRQLAESFAGEAEGLEVVALEKLRSIDSEVNM